MEYFLSAERQMVLIRHLTRLGMPVSLARTFASWPDDINRVDANVAALIGCVRRHAKALNEAHKLGNEEFENAHRIPLQADMMIVNTYRAEIACKGLPLILFKRSAMAISAALAEVEKVRTDLRTRVVSYTGTLQ